MKNLITVIMIALVWFSSVSFALNQPGSDKEKQAHEAFQALLKQADKNKDGKISKDEYLVTLPDKNAAEDKFKELDLNGDGFITEEEYVKVTVDTAMDHSMDDNK